MAFHHWRWPPPPPPEPKTAMGVSRASKALVEPQGTFGFAALRPRLP